ncbi:MAG: hypothetical protein IJA15_05090 [Clostridia bacterium]|nr:hypothetical protein [Clostridia bacterium]
MKKTTKKILSLLVAAVMSSSLVACGGGGTTTPGGGDNSAIGGGNEQVDKTKYQLYVSNYDGGYGSDWLYAVKDRYEKLHENDQYEGGKVGIQVIVNPIKEKAGGLENSILGGVEDVYFSEYAYYYDLQAKGVLGDITEAVTADLSAYNQRDAVGTTIKDKLTAQQEAYYNIDGKYYGIPHYAGYNGLTYNRRLFNNNNWYFAKNPVGSDLQGRFITKTNTTKSNGPDGLAGTYDDGLPATYEEFFALCEWIYLGDDIPVMVHGNGYKEYLHGLLSALNVDHNGLEQGLLNYTFDGVAENLVTMDANGNIIPDGEMTPITVNNGYELTRQAGKAYALKFLQTLLHTNDFGYMNEDFDSPSHSHTNAQRDFIRSEYEDSLVAMLVDGIWWQAEAKQAFSDASKEFGNDFSAMGSDFAWMPLPKATSDKVGEGVTLYDQINSICFMKGGITGEKRAVAIDFIKFCHTHESLVEFTLITNTPKSLNYTLTADEKAQLTPFGRSILEMKEQPTTKILCPYATSDFYKANQRMICEIFYSRLDGSNYIHPTELFVRAENRKTPTQIFNGMQEYRSSIWAEWMANVSK